MFLGICAVVWIVVKISDGPNISSPIWLIGFGSLLTISGALFGEAIRNFIWHPELQVSYVHGSGYVDKPVMTWEFGDKIIAADCYYFSFRIANVGTRRAENVEVQAFDLRDANGALIRRYAMNLKWAYLDPSKIILDGISPKMERFCNLGHIISPSQRVSCPHENHPDMPSDKSILSLDLEAQPNHGSHLLKPGKYELMIRVAAANHRPIVRNFAIELNGNWYDDQQTMLNSGISISLI